MRVSTLSLLVWLLMFVCAVEVVQDVRSMGCRYAYLPLNQFRANNTATTRMFVSIKLDLLDGNVGIKIWDNERD